MALKPLSLSNLEIIRGKTFSQMLRWEQPVLVYKAITAISKNGPPVITAVGHGVPTGWRVAVVGVLGMTEINARNWPLTDDDFQKATVLTVDTIELNAVNAASFKTYTSGGYLVYRQPVDMTGMTGRMQIRDPSTGALLEDLTTANSKLEINTTDKYIRRVLEAADTSTYTWSKGVFDLELVATGGEPVYLIDSGNVKVVDEATT